LLTCLANRYAHHDTSSVFVFISIARFPPIADAYASGLAPSDGGVEEVTAVALQQTLFGAGTTTAKLLRFTSAEGSEDGDGTTRTRSIETSLKQISSNLIA